jgi:class 3 adenylate cyclase
MIALSDKTDLWLKHIAGDAQLTNLHGTHPIYEAVELNEKATEILSTFGNQTFSAIVGFVDMRGFSTAAAGKTPVEVKQLVEPFVSAVVDAAQKYDCFIDKTIGDEVMIVMPEFGQDAELSDARLSTRGLLVVDATALLHNVMRRLEALGLPYRLSAGMAFGSLLLSRVGTTAYGEWTVYGNTVNAAKRLQSRAGKSASDDAHLLALGAIVQEQPKFGAHLRSLLHEIVPCGGGPIIFENADVQTESMKGVGDVVFVASAIRSRPECP